MHLVVREGELFRVGGLLSLSIERQGMDTFKVSVDLTEDLKVERTHRPSPLRAHVERAKRLTQAEGQD